MALVFPQEVTLYQTGDVPEGASVSACIFSFSDYDNRNHSSTTSWMPSMVNENPISVKARSPTS